jgi:hypothetical protein
VARWFWTWSWTYAVVAAAVGFVLFVAALAGGLGLKSLIILAAAAFWAVMARFDRRRARAAHRHRQLRRRRLERTSDGSSTGPYRDD